MPRKELNYKTISIPREIYEYAEKFLESHFNELTLKRIRSMADLTQEALIHFIFEFEKEGTSKVR